MREMPVLRRRSKGGSGGGVTKKIFFFRLFLSLFHLPLLFLPNHRLNLDFIEGTAETLFFALANL